MHFWLWHSVEISNNSQTGRLRSRCRPPLIDLAEQNKPPRKQQERSGIFSLDKRLPRRPRPAHVCEQFATVVHARLKQEKRREKAHELMVRMVLGGGVLV